MLGKVGVAILLLGISTYLGVPNTVQVHAASSCMLVQAGAAERCFGPRQESSALALLGKSATSPTNLVKHAVRMPLVQVIAAWNGMTHPSGPAHRITFLYGHYRGGIVNPMATAPKFLILTELRGSVAPHGMTIARNPGPPCDCYAGAPPPGPWFLRQDLGGGMALEITANVSKAQVTGLARSFAVLAARHLH